MKTCTSSKITSVGWAMDYSLIMAAIVPLTTDNISTLYNNVVKCEVIREMGGNMRTKSQAQVSRKLVLLQDEQAVVYALRLD